MRRCTSLPFLSLLLAVCVCGFPRLSAQEDSESEPESVLVNFVTLRDLPELFVQRDGEFETLRVGKGKRGAFYELRNRSITVYAEAPPNPATDFEGGKVPVGDVSVESGIERAMIFLSGSDGALRHAVLNEGFEVHPPGKTRILNLTDLDIAVNLGGDPVRISSRGPVLAESEAKAHGYAPLEILLRYPDGRVKMGRRSAFRHPKEGSRIFIIVRRQTPEQYFAQASNETVPMEEGMERSPPDPSRYNDRILTDILVDTSKPDEPPKPVAILE